MQAYLAEINRFSTSVTPLENGDGSVTTPEQLKLLPKMRAQLQDLLDDELHSDRFIIRFLIAENFNLEKAIVMLRAHLEWRRDNHVDLPLSELLASVPASVQAYAQPPIFAGETKDGFPIFWDAPGRLDVQGVMRSCLPADIVQYHGVVFMEHVYDRLRQQCIKHNKLIDKMVVVQDLSHLNIMQARPFFPVVSQITACRNANYPQILKAMIIMNAPTMIDVGWKLIRRLLRERTRRKITFAKSSTAVAKLKGIVDEHNLPKRYGGRMADPALPKPVALEDYLSTSLNESMDKSLLVAARSQKILEYTLKMDDVLTWTVEVGGNRDIGLGVRCGAQWPMPVTRVDSTLVPIMGRVVAEHDGLFELVFDNSYSWTNSKTLRYDINVVSTRAQLEQAAEAEDRFKRLSDGLVTTAVAAATEPTPTSASILEPAPSQPVFQGSIQCDNLASV
eukprot:m.101794 g.101794  ORF g.101794 m.101794 type:complete len:449 (+) comp15185_c0_seq1:165-1511(+)